jgi:hypothetical integral membrane protein (TIGR02206 family)
MNPPLNIVAPGRWDAFVSYSGLHALTLVVCAILIVTPMLLARALSKDAEQTLRRALAALAIAYWIAYAIGWNWHGLDPRTGLPLQICDVNGLIAPFALLTGRRWLRATLYFWTSTLTLQAFIQPALKLGPASPVFWAFWIAHSLIAACAVYDVVVLGFRPRWSDLGRTLAVSAIYLALVVPVDVALGANYGFVGNPADTGEVPPFIGALGPWPLRAVILVALAALGFVVVLLPWVLAELTSPRRAGRGRIAKQSG